MTHINPAKGDFDIVKAGNRATPRQKANLRKQSIDEYVKRMSDTLAIVASAPSYSLDELNELSFSANKRADLVNELRIMTLRVRTMLARFG